MLFWISFKKKNNKVESETCFDAVQKVLQKQKKKQNKTKNISTFSNYWRRNVTSLYNSIQSNQMSKKYMLELKYKLKWLKG